MIQDMTKMRWALLIALGSTVGGVFWVVGNSVQVAVTMGLCYQAVVLLLAFIIKNNRS
jgi:hypothetical protein